MSARAPDDVLQDLELIQAMYPDRDLVHLPNGNRIQLEIAPNTAGDARQEFITVTLEFDCLSKKWALPKYLGMDEVQAAQLLLRVRGTTSFFEGVTTVVELITQWNEEMVGDCPVCLMPFGNGPMFRLRSCFHAAHRECVRGWWQWEGNRVICFAYIRKGISVSRCSRSHDSDSIILHSHRRCSSTRHG